MGVNEFCKELIVLRMKNDALLFEINKKELAFAQMREADIKRRQEDGVLQEHRQSTQRNLIENLKILNFYKIVFLATSGAGAIQCQNIVLLIIPSLQHQRTTSTKTTRNEVD